MKTIISYLVAYFFKLALWFRYRVTVKGLDKLNKETLKKPGGVLFLPNHPAIFVDPLLVTLAAWPKFPIRPMIVEYMYNTPGIHWLMRLIDALPIPNFSNSSNSIKKRKSERVTEAVIQGLREGENFLIYPAGKTKDSSIESIGGASAVHHIIKEVPELNVVLVRVKGLWGSMFSRAFLGVSPPMMPTIWQGVKHVFKNLIFFTPRRKVVIELEAAPADFPYGASRVEMNRWLESWYNKPDGLTQQKTDLPGDSFVLVSLSMWGEKYPEMTKSAVEVNEDISIAEIPEHVKKKIIDKIAEMTELDPKKIKPEMSLSSDLGLDSLDAAEFAAFLQDQFDVEGASAPQLTTVQQVMAIAAHKVALKNESQDKEEHDLTVWKKKVPEAICDIPAGNTIPEVFLNSCARVGNQAACVDMMSGVLTYDQLKMRAILMADYIRNLPGESIGILLPASTAATLLILATQLAGKIPVMINWTVGPRHLESVLSLSKVEIVLSSWAFLDRLDNVNLDPIEKHLVMMEDVRRNLGLIAKLKAYIRSKQGTQAILKAFKIDKKSSNDQAVLLFTSGTESMPKGVPLSHMNILSNLRAAKDTVELTSQDILFGILPPFHAFGFAVSAMLPVLTGVRVAFSPDPTDGYKLLKGFERWGITLVCGAPTFIKALFRNANPEQLTSLRLCITGAEKAPPELFSLMDRLGKKDSLVEGYGITECSPALTLNHFGKHQKGVGPALSNVDLLVVHPETLEPVAKGSQGLILARGPNIFSGYLNPGISSPFVTALGKEWYKTGDLGNLDEEGYLTISGRLKRFIKIGPEMVSLAAIEDVLLKSASDKGISSDQEGPILAICAKEIPGEKPKIFLFTRFETSLEDVNQQLRQAGLSNLIRVHHVNVLDEIPIMGSGKINYRVLENEYLS